LRGEGSDRADLHGVAGEVRAERSPGERRDFDLVAALEEVDERFACDLLGEPRAAGALDAPLAIERDERADVDWLRPVALLFDEPALPRTVRERLVLERALA